MWFVLLVVVNGLRLGMAEVGEVDFDGDGRTVKL
jgi:hypothetical protein